MPKRLLVLASLLLAQPAIAQPPFEQPLTPETKIPLGDVSGRIDHFAYDPADRLLFVAELGNDSVGIVDLKNGKTRRLTGLREPQGLAWHAATRTLYVANAGDGSVRLYQGPGFTPAGTIALGNDADNIRVDGKRDRIVVGYGSGGLAVIDPTSRRKVADIALKGHPESFQFDEEGRRIFVNVPGARQVAVVDAGQGKQVSTLDPGGAHSNFSMAVDALKHRVLVVTRSPEQLIAFSTQDGRRVAIVETCGDADDVFVDDRRQRVYVACGDGLVEVFGPHGDGYQSIGKIPTVSGARTALFVADADRLYVAVRARFREPAAIWVFRPAP
jgi:DNA-binding beta-propeller fold protein YncE